MRRERIIKWTMAALGILPIWLGGCAGDTDTDTANRGPYFAERVNFTGLGNLNVMLQRPPMHERGVSSVAVIYKGNGVLDLDHDIDAFFEPDFFEELASGQLIPEALGEDLFVTMLNQGGYIQARGYSRTHGELAKYFGQSSWSGMTYEASDGEALVKDLGRRGHDTVLLVKEIDISDYRFGKKSVKGAKGILSNETGLAVYASFQVALIDTASGELRPLGTYIQASLKEVPDLVGKPGFQAFSADERERIVKAIETLIENNVRQTLLVFKMVPIRGQEFMTWEGLPESESVGFDYPG